MPQQPRRDAPAPRDDSHVTPPLDGTQNLPDGLRHRLHPERPLAFGHRRIDQPRPYVGDRDRQSALRDPLAQPLGVVDLIGFRGVVSRSGTAAAQSSHRRDDDQMAAALPLEQPASPVDDRRPAQDIGTDRRRLDRKVEIGIQVSRTGRDDAQLQTAQHRDQTVQCSERCIRLRNVGDGTAVRRRIGRRDFAQQRLPSPHESDAVAPRRQFFGQAASDSRRGADNDRSFHRDESSYPKRKNA